MAEISLLICIALIFLAYTHAYYNRDSIPLCALFAASTTTLYFFWLRVRAEIIARIMEKVAAANAAYHRAEHVVAQTYYSTARRTLAVVDKVESAIQTLYDIPRRQKFLAACLATITVWIIAFFYAWYTDEEETMIVLFVVPCGILSIAFGWSMELFQQYELHNADPASCKALDTYTPSPQPEIPARPETPTEKRRRERAAKHEANQAQLRCSWAKDEEQKKWEDEHRDGLGRASLCSLMQSSPRCSKSGVHYPQPIVFPEDLPPTPRPKPQLTILPPIAALPEPQPEPKPKPFDEEEYQSLLADLRESLGLLPTMNTVTPINNGSTQQPVQKPTTGDDDQTGPSQQPPHEPNDSKQKNEKPHLPPGHPHTWQKAGMTAADVWMAYQPSSMTTSHHFDYQQLFIATRNAPTLAFGNYRRPAEQEKDKDRLQDLYKASCSKNTSRPIAREKSSKLAPSGANASPQPASNPAAAAQGPEMSGNLPNSAQGSAPNAKPLGANPTPQAKANPFAFALAPDFSNNLPKFAHGNSGNGSNSTFNGTIANGPGGAQPFTGAQPAGSGPAANPFTPQAGGAKNPSGSKPSNTQSGTKKSATSSFKSGAAGYASSAAPSDPLAAQSNVLGRRALIKMWTGWMVKTFTKDNVKDMDSLAKNDAIKVLNQRLSGIENFCITEDRKWDDNAVNLEQAREIQLTRKDLWKVDQLLLRISKEKESGLDVDAADKAHVDMQRIFSKCPLR